MSKLEDWQLAIIDALIDAGGVFASAVSGSVERVGSPAYKRTSLAVLALERMEFITVERRYQDEAKQSNIIERIVIA